MFITLLFNPDWRRYTLAVIPLFSIIASESIVVFFQKMKSKRALVIALLLAYFVFAFLIGLIQFQDMYIRFQPVADYLVRFTNHNGKPALYVIH